MNPTTSLLGVAGDFNQKVGMTLAEIAYTPQQYLRAQLAYTHYATEGLWRFKWLGVTAGNQMYVAQKLATKQ